MVVSVSNVEEPSNMQHNPKYLWNICKGAQFLNDCSSINRVLEVWSKYSHQLMVDPLISDSKVPGEKGKVRFPCRLCEGREASKSPFPSTTHHKSPHDTKLVTPPPQRHHMSYMVCIKFWEISKLINDPIITFSKVVYLKSIKYLPKNVISMLSDMH